MLYVSSLSGGKASAVATDRAIQRYGKENFVLWFADTNYEDEDLYRFLHDLVVRWDFKLQPFSSWDRHVRDEQGGVVAPLQYVSKMPHFFGDLLAARSEEEREMLAHPERFRDFNIADPRGRLVVYLDGRTPYEVAVDKQIIPNHRVAPCTFELKIKPFNTYISRLLEQGFGPITNLIGLDWIEMHRVKSQRKRYADWENVEVDFPLLWKPYLYEQHTDIIRSWGMQEPRLYRAGASHNNCKMRCVKQGIGEWKRLWLTFPEQYLEIEAWEQEQRAKGGARANYSLMQDRTGGVKTTLTLREAREQRFQDLAIEFEGDDDRFSCFCSSGAELYE